MSPHTIAVIGCRVAALVVLAAVALWIVDPPRPYLPGRFCAEGVEAITTLFDKRYLNAPRDERCDVVIGPRTVAAGLAAGGVIALVTFGIPLWLPRRRTAA